MISSHCKPKAKPKEGKGISNPHTFLVNAFRSSFLPLGLAQVYN